jgi:hypothetical protein
MAVPKDGMEKVEEANTEIKEENTDMEKKSRTLDELKAAKDKLDKKIQEMEGGNENVNEYYGVDPKLDILTLALGVGLPVATAAAALVQQIGIKGALNLLKKSSAPKEKKAEVQKAIVAAEKGADQSGM